MNLLQMRQTLEELLGYYSYTRLPDGTYQRAKRDDAPGSYWQGTSFISPAFYVQGSQRVSSNWDIKGLEATLIQKPKVRFFPNIGSLERHQDWTLYLQQYDQTKTVSDHELVVLRHFGGDAQSTYWRRNDEDLSDRVMITIKTIDFDLITYPTDASLDSVPSPVENSFQKTFFDQ